MKKISMIVVAIAMAAGITACNGGTGPDPVYHTWYDFFGHACGTLKPDCTYVNSTGSAKAMWWNDPYYSSFASPTWATVFDTDMGYYVSAYGYYGYNGVFYDYYTGRAINEGDDVSTRDALAAVGNKEEDVIRRAGTQWAAKYGLDTKVGVQIARHLNDFNKIGKNRERTEKDVTALTKRALGMDYSKIKEAINTNDQAGMDSLIAEGAKHLNTSPENMKKIINATYFK